MINQTIETDIDAVREDIARIGDNLALMFTIAKSLEIVLDDDFNFDKADVENLLSALKEHILKAQDVYERIDRVLIL